MLKTANLIRVFFFFLTASLIIYSCKKDNFPEPEGPKVSSDNPQALSAALKIWHGQRISGAAPAPAGDGPELDPEANPTINALSGRYAIIKPEVASGEVAGYYIAVNGSGEYFKIDYSKPLTGRKGNAGKQNKFSPLRSLKDRLSARGNEDSLIVITLPENIQAPDTFCVTYCAYDAQGNIGEPVTTCIIVDKLGGDENSTWLEGTWKFTADSYTYTDWQTGNLITEQDTIIYNQWELDDSLFCYYDSLNSEYVAIRRSEGYVGPYQYLSSDSFMLLKSNLIFANNGAYKLEESYKERFWETYAHAPSCDQLVLPPRSVWDEDYSEIGGWSYNSATGKLIIVYEYLDDPYAYEETGAAEFDVVKISNNHFILRFDDDFEDGWYRLEK